MKKRSISIFIVSLSLLFSQELVDRFKVPVNIKTKIGFGYDSNFLRLSDRDIESGNAYDYGILSTVDSPIIKPTVKLIYSPILFKNHLTNFISSFSYSYYNEAKEKSYLISNFSLEYKIKSYSWIKFGFRDIPRFYLRNFIDRDVSLVKYHECTFSNQKFFVSYSFPLKWLKKTWVKTQYFSENEFYNSNFTEFDLNKHLFQLELNHRMKSENDIKILIGYGQANNFNYDNGMISTEINRSYVFDNIRLSYYLKSHGFQKINKFVISNFIQQRYYDLFSKYQVVDDWKYYLEGKTDVIIDWNFFNDIGIKTIYQYRWRDVQSNVFGNFDWIEDVKQYGKHEIWLELSFQFITDILY